MTVLIRKWIFSQNSLKLYYPSSVNTNFLSTTIKLFAKKKINIKNKFTFRDEFQRHANKVNSERRNVSQELFSEELEDIQKHDDLNWSSHGFVSAELFSEQRKSGLEKKFTQPKTNKKPSLAYKGEILFGIHPVYLALLQRKRIFHHLYCREEDSVIEDNVSRQNKIIKLAKSMDIPISFVDSRGLRILAPGAVHQGVCLDAGFFPLSSWTEGKLEFDTPESRPVWLVLDEILDPMNVGAIIRSAHYFGVKRIFTVRGNSCKLSPTVSKASSGSLEVMDVYQIDNLEEFIKKRKEKGWCIVSTTAYIENKNEFHEPLVSATQFSISKPTILILGNEGRGISQTVLKLCDSLISIEPGQLLPEGIDSLNVSVATGVLLYILNSSNTIKR